MCAVTYTVLPAIVSCQTAIQPRVEYSYSAADPFAEHGHIREEDSFARCGGVAAGNNI